MDTMPGRHGLRSRAALGCAAIVGALAGCNQQTPPSASRVVQGTARDTAACVGTNAHPGHGQDTPLRNALTCADCHQYPSSTPQFGPLATARGSTPTYDVASATCAGVYCHGATLAAGTTTTAGAAPLVPTHTTPIWTVVDGSQAYCGACHGLPPDTGQHSYHAYLGRDCYLCHGLPYRTRLDLGPPAVNPALHVNGTADIALVNWDATALKPGSTTEAGTSAACHGGTRYWYVTSGSCL